MTEDIKPVVFTDESAGTYLSGAMGWHNHFRVCELARNMTHWVLPTGDHDILDAYRADTDDPDGSIADGMLGQGGLVDEATKRLQDHTAPGLVWVWDMGELSLTPLCQAEGWDPRYEDCEHCERTGGA